jgi:very-short-patch-repair endonuclease
MDAQLDSPDVRIARVAAVQHGVITRKQLTEIGLGRGGIASRVQCGRLHRLHRGVYAVGHAAPSEARGFMAAVLACGEGAALSHVSATVLWKFLNPQAGPIHVTSPSTSGKMKRRGIVLHRSPSLSKTVIDGEWREAQVTERYRIPVTSPRRTIEDLEGTIEAYLWRRAKRQAELRGYKLRLPTDRSRSDLESDFLRFLTRHRFPHPEVNVKIGKYTVDFLWRAERLVVETDFFDYHRGSVAFEDDHQREMDLRQMGYTVRRYTGDQLDRYPAEIAAELGEDLRVLGR